MQEVQHHTSYAAVTESSRDLPPPEHQLQAIASVHQELYPDHNPG